MALNPLILIGPTNTPSSAVMDLVGADIPATLMADNLTAGETINVFRVTAGGENGETVFQEGAAVQLSSVNNTITINSPMRIGVTIATVAELVTVYVAKQGFV